MAYSKRALTDAERACVRDELKSLILKNNWSNSIAGDRLGVSPGYISNIKSDVQPCGLPFAAKLAQVSGRPLSAFVGDDLVQVMAEQAEASGKPKPAPKSSPKLLPPARASRDLAVIANEAIAEVSSRMRKVPPAAVMMLTATPKRAAVTVRGLEGVRELEERLDQAAEKNRQLRRFVADHLLLPNMAEMHS